MTTHKKLTDRFFWLLGTTGATVGLVASFLQVIQLTKHLKNPEQVLICDMNAVFSCNNVFDGWQSSVFGFSNSILCVAFFAVLLGVMLAGLSSRGVLGKRLRLSMQFFSLFFLGFGAWYLWASAYQIGSLCIYCIACYLGVIALNAAWMRINAADLPLSKAGKARLKKSFDNNSDLAYWTMYAIVIGLMLVYRFV